MAIEKVKAFFAKYGMADKIRELDKTASMPTRILVLTGYSTPIVRSPASVSMCSIFLTVFLNILA